MVDWRSDDRELLARILTAEAGNQGPVGMLAAGNVIMNRANTTGYGDGVRGVIMRPGQFSPMNSVTGYARGEQGQNIDALTPSETAYMVADSLLSGTANDITGGATHFYNPDISQPSWAEGREFTRIGDHVFGRADDGRGATPTSRVNTMNQPMQSQPEQDRPRGLRGLLGNPDLFDRLAIGLGGMTLNPNTALMQMSADRIAGRREERTTRETGNRTAEWLRSQGRDDLAGAVLSGALGSRDAVTIAYQPEAQGQILSADQMRQMFPGTQIEDGLYNLRPDGTANKVGGGGPILNIDQSSASEFEDTFAKGDADTLLEIYNVGLQAQRNLGRIDMLDQALAAAPTGGVGVIKQIAGEFGIATEGVEDIQVAQALINSLVPEQRQPGSGPMSDADLALFKESLPRIINQPGGNRMIIDTMRAIAEYDRLGAEIIQRMRLPDSDPNKLNRSQAFQLLQNRPDPLANFRVPSGSNLNDAASEIESLIR